MLSLSQPWGEVLKPCCGIMQEVYLKYTVPSCREFYSVTKGRGALNKISTGGWKIATVLGDDLRLNALLQCLVTSLYLIDGHFTNESWWRSFCRGSHLGSALPSCPLMAPVPGDICSQWPCLHSWADSFVFSTQQEEFLGSFPECTFAAPDGTFQSHLFSWSLTLVQPGYVGLQSVVMGKHRSYSGWHRF